MTSAAAKKAWETRRRHGGHNSSRSAPKLKTSAARRAHLTMKKGRRIHIHSPNVKRIGHAATTYAPPKNWWERMTKQPHGSAGRPLSASAAGHLWFKVYDDKKRLEIIKQYG